MRHEPSGSWPPVQQARSKQCPACGQTKRPTDFPATPADVSSCCRDCGRAASRLASRRRAAAIRLLIAAHPEEWAGLLGLVRGLSQVGASHLKGGGRRA
jgi:uncharacterized protein (DUF983 family)